MIARLLTTAVAAAVLLAAPAGADIPGGALKLGVLNDMSGPYADPSGRWSVVAATMAAEDFARDAGPGAPRVETAPPWRSRSTRYCASGTAPSWPARRRPAT